MIEKNGVKKEEEVNIVKIAGRGYEIYNHTILLKLQKFDQIEIQVLDTYLDTALYIINLWSSVGVLPPKFPITFEKREEDILTKDGKKRRAFINKITLSKVPEIYRFTKI